MRLLTALLALIAAPAFGAITFVETSTSQAVSATSRAPTEPSGAQEGDLILAVCTAATSGTWTDPADFTQLTTKVSSGGSQRNTYIGYKFRASTSGSGYTFSHNGSADAIRCTLNAYRGVNSTTPWDVTYSEGSHYAEHQDSPNTANPAITTATNGAWVILIQALNGDAATAASPPSNYTERSDYFGTSPEHYIATREIASAGTETPGMYSRSDADFADVQLFTLALRPATSGAQWTSGPTISDRSDTSYTFGFATDISATVYGVACLPARMAPDGEQIVNGDCGDDMPAESTCSTETTGGVPDTCVLEGIVYPRHDLYVIACPEEGICE